MESFSANIHSIIGARKPVNNQRLMAWYEDALDLETACGYWEKAVELLRSKIRKTAKVHSHVLRSTLSSARTVRTSPPAIARVSGRTSTKFRRFVR